MARGGAPRPAQRGWTLLLLVLLLVVALIATVGIGIAVSEGLRAALSRLNQTKAFYLAHAGVMDAIACYLSPGGGKWFALGEFSVVPNEVFIRPLTSPQRDFLLWELKQGCMTAVVNCLSPVPVSPLLPSV